MCRMAECSELFLCRHYWEDNSALVNSVLVYNTGRSVGQFASLIEEKQGMLAVPDVLITAVGTKVRTTEEGPALCPWPKGDRWAKHGTRVERASETEEKALTMSSCVCPGLASG